MHSANLQEKKTMELKSITLKEAKTKQIKDILQYEYIIVFVFSDGTILAIEQEYQLLSPVNLDLTAQIRRISLDDIGNMIYPYELNKLIESGAVLKAGISYFIENDAQTEQRLKEERLKLYNMLKREFEGGH